MELTDLRHSRSRIRRRLSYSYNNRGPGRDKLTGQLRIPSPVRSNEMSEEEEETSDSEYSDGVSPTPNSREELNLNSTQWWPPTEFWNTCISCQIPPGSDIRDFFALERTFLAYSRTASTIAMFAVVITQLLFLSGPVEHFGHNIFPAFCVALLGMATVLQVVAAIKYWKWERGIMEGKAMVGGWEVMLVGLLTAGVVIPTAVFVLMGVL
ncbi:hypothetical protein BJ508DRAFT_78053 [Ascobolus immersus RN42]|uniref:DUF202 domain-containing protein n=1 Tax=Ascobolus immersus RN42 TaxID=1160509 RepID=A0A3N4IAF2_ASCIM|nr:hypothetical protein BJ508DRAFT_78053 [Ascobolus immersus RN42]